MPLPSLIDFYRFSLISIDVHRFRSILIDPHRFSLILIDTHWFLSILTDFHRFSSVFIDFHRIVSIFISFHRFSSIHSANSNNSVGQPNDFHWLSFGTAGGSVFGPQCRNLRQWKTWIWAQKTMANGIQLPLRFILPKWKTKIWASQSQLSIGFFAAPKASMVNQKGAPPRAE